MQAAHPAAHPAGMQQPGRVIAHIDLDCFYAQVEQKRLGIPADVPVGVQQWNGLIAVNYAARAAGITRHMRAAEAKKLCPQLVCVHVATIGGAGPEPSHDDTAAVAGQEAPEAGGHAPAAAAAAAAAGAAAGEVEGSSSDRQSAKASLQRYRWASADIMRVLAELAPGCPFEKASIDEVFLDVTTMAARELSAAEEADGGLQELLARATAGSSVLGDGGFQADTAFDRLAAAGAVIALRLRGAVFERLGFTCSAGVAASKLLAKIGSAMNKPNKQTVVLQRGVEGVMQDLPLGKIKGLGGKLGKQLEQLGAPTAGAAAALSWELLVDAFGPKARWVWETVRGLDDEAVTPKSLVKQITSCKSFEPSSDPAVVTRWLRVLAAELAERLAEDEAEHNRRPRTLVLQYRQSYASTVERSVRGPLSGSTSSKDSPTTECLARAGAALFARLVPAPFPLMRLALAATDFVEQGGSSAGSSAAMARFLAAGAAQQQQQQEQQQQLPGNGGLAPESRGQQQHAKPRLKRKQEAQAHMEQFFAAAAPIEPAAAAAAAAAAGAGDDAAGHAERQQQQDEQAGGCLPLKQQQAAAPDDGTITADGGPLQQQEEQRQQGNEEGDGAAMSADEATALSRVDVAEQARILTDIQASQRRQQQQQQQQQGSARGSQPGGKKRKGGNSSTASQGRDKQRSITSMFASKQ